MDELEEIAIAAYFRDFPNGDQPSAQSSGNKVALYNVNGPLATYVVDETGKASRVR
ncbi:hypothetical protein Spa11_12530 [Botrimarina mediterranea]|uniref:Uncharacterized protein n=1 Tax=Botrimarina mediterranea TaxID=2528022 RepID=A0A518K5J2_9BACT|nr:hypothetical protein Spa11_12530 [Botrimarina mediterranea]